MTCSFEVNSAIIEMFVCVGVRDFLLTDARAHVLSSPCVMLALD